MASARKVLITGASGLLGRELLRHFTQQGWDCLGVAFSRAREKLVKVDLCRRDEVEKVIDNFDPHVVVHAAAERRPDVVSKQKDSAKALNVGATETLAQLCEQRGLFLLYISTDYVFDGKEPPYSTAAATNPLNTYGVTKRDGEVVVQRCSTSAVLRVPVLYGPVESLSESAVTTIFSVVLDSSTQSKLSHFEQRYPTHVQDVAQVCELMCSLQIARPGAGLGVWHCSGDDCLTKYSMALAMGEVFGLSTAHLLPVTEPSPGSPRPFDCRLDCGSTRAAFPGSQTPFKEGICKVLKPFLPAPST